MKSINSFVSVSHDQSIGLLHIDYPPVNALSQQVRQGLLEGLDYFEKDASTQAILLVCQGKTFIAGADIKEFSSAPLAPHLPEVVNCIEACLKPVVACIFGTTLGGGFEVALACHYRIVKAGSKVGFPEVNLGLIPGAGGTQRITRLVSVSRALEMVTSGQHYSVDSLTATDLFDQRVELLDKSNNRNQDYLQSCITWVTQQLASNQLPLKKTADRPIDNDIQDWSQSLTKIENKAKGRQAPNIAAQVLQAGLNLSIGDGMQLERKAFLSCKSSPESAALRYVFGAERQAAKFVADTDQTDIQAYEVSKVGVIGGGTMGSGIATAFLSAGFQVSLIEQNQQALDLARQRIESNFARNLKSKRMTQEQVDGYLKQLELATDFAILSDSQLVIEAVFENMSVKKEIFQTLEKVCSVECILASNTSYLDINEIASSVSRAKQVIGMHFFSPANIMKLVEIVRSKKSGPEVLKTAFAVAKRLQKVPVEVAVCFGFAGNRMYTRYGREVQQMLLEGAKVGQVDKALTDWGMAMGPLAVADMSGLDIGYQARATQPFPKHDKGYFKPAELMFELGRYGQKTHAGYYQYSDAKRMPDPQVDQLIRQKAESLGISQQAFSDETIVQRALLALINEGFQLLKDGIVKRASDIDVIWLYGYGFPRHKGGPMFQAQQMGADLIEKCFTSWRAEQGVEIWPEIDFSLLQ
ncbi:MAG: 3-hydroxyacyl-CoA dehydrogenase NAD-binding domain-containing protein [Enterobacterales bacterium]|nr:3-hydroxyacyl-CoA dehydrogenase NAD-binding domain-containing protein [Enterobacterales bacterium]